MNKNIIALAVAAGFAAPMAANAAPTLYGQLQMELASTDTATGPSVMRSDDNKRGRLGLKGSEDLGNGLSAIYKFEWQVDTSDADLYDGTRESFVGLKGDWGTFTAGTLKSAYKYAGGVKYDPFVATFLEARSRGGMSGKITDLSSIGFGLASGAYGHHGFLSDNIAYNNKFDNFQVSITTSLDEAGGTKGADGDITASLKYKGKSWEAFVAHASDDQVGPFIGEEYTATKIGGQWKSGSHKISAQLENTEYTGGATTFADADVYFVGYQFKMGKNIFVAQMGNTSFDTGTVFNSGLDVDYNAFGIIHKYSKKTRLFAGISTHEDNAGTDNSATSVGLRVDF